ncbi:DUF3962 domain-containing protein [Paenibacillus polymyxa]|uniref:pPIWI_RE module domain-containing protein n=1 Tax=Paenibacillus polymyxa TaxID=1406 RepID=UPI001BEB907C|nr:DUF3962 domain-containing protein [Paenibacillus polymyxa]MBT2285842.1 DUF3962 domain-containing protein [Paenibacillus polymyxa]
MKSLELFALEINEDTFFDETVYVMYMPDSWRNYFNTQTTAGGYKLASKVDSLGKKLRSIFPEIITGNINYKVLQQNIPWIVSTKEIPEKYIKQLTLGWFASLRKQSIAELPPEISNAELAWSMNTFGEIHQNVQKYDWIPGLAAVMFCQNPRVVELAPGLKEELHFHHTFFNGKHECVTKPIIKSSYYDPFSYVIQVSLQYRGGKSDQLLLVLKIGRRRYLKKPQIDVHKNECYLKNNHACSVLISVEDPYSIHSSRSFSQFQFERKKKLDDNKENNKFTSWISDIDRIYWDVIHGQVFEPDLILLDPQRYLQGSEQITAWVINHNSFNGKGNSVKPGLGLSEKSGLFNCFADSLSKLQIIPLPHVSEIERSGSKMNDQRLPAIVHEQGKLVIEFYGSKEMFNRMEELYISQQQSLGKHAKSPEAIFNQHISSNTYLLNSNNNLIIEFEHYAADEIVTELEIDRYTKEMAYNKRVNQILKKIGNKSYGSDIRTLALVEINKKEEFRDGADPKLAVREALRKVGRLTQFIHPLTDEKKMDDSRMLSSILDLYNDVGILSNNATRLPVDKCVLSFDLIKLNNKYYPVASRMTGTEVCMKMLGVESWTRLGDAPFYVDHIKSLDKPKKSNNTGAIFYQFMISILEEELRYWTGEIVVLLNASLRNGWLSSITNSRIIYDETPFLDGRLQNETRLKFVRINTNEDVPQYRIINTTRKEAFNKESGIFKDAVGIYYGIGGRPTAWSGVKNKDIKFTAPSKLLLQQTAVEYIPLGPFSEEERDQLAILVDQLRRIGLTYDKHTKLPYTLRIVEILKKYMHHDEWRFTASLDEEVEVEADDGVLVTKELVNLD